MDSSGIPHMTAKHKRVSSVLGGPPPVELWTDMDGKQWPGESYPDRSRITRYSLNGTRYTDVLYITKSITLLCTV